MAFIISGSAGSVKVSEENKQTASAASCEEGTVIRIGNRLQAGERYSLIYSLAERPQLKSVRRHRSIKTGQSVLFA